MSSVILYWFSWLRRIWKCSPPLSGLLPWTGSTKSVCWLSVPHRSLLSLSFSDFFATHLNYCTSSLASPPLLTEASCPCDPVCTLLPECVSKEFMSESPFLIEIWASVHLYIHRARLHRTFWKKELAFHTIGAFSHLWVRPARNLCRYNPVHWHPRKSFAAADCKPPYGLWMLKHWYFFPDKTNIFHSRVDIFFKC